MLMTSLRMVAVAGLIATAASCGQEDPAPNQRAERCQRIASATCAVFVRCRVLVQNTERVVTNQDCERIVEQFVPDCVSGAQYDGVSSATDAEVSACVSGFQGFSCSDLCNQVPADPAACQALDTAPNDNFFECAP